MVKQQKSGNFPDQVALSSMMNSETLTSSISRNICCHWGLFWLIQKNGNSMPVQNTWAGFVFELLRHRLQRRLVDIDRSAAYQRKEGELPGKTYGLPPPSWAKKGQSREMIQYGFYTNSNRVYPGWGRY